MTYITRRPSGSQPAGYGTTPEKTRNTQNFNKDLRYIQGFRTSLTQGRTPLNITLLSPGKTLLGISIMPAVASTLNDTQASLSVNNNNLLSDFAVINADPTQVQGLIFFPTPQPLQGVDTIVMSFLKNDANTVVAYVNVFYVPR